jgi:hypothetical protein
MSLCELCEERAEKLFRCKECDSKFCSSCGDPNLRICDYCQEDGEDEVYENLSYDDEDLE